LEKRKRGKGQEGKKSGKRKAGGIGEKTGLGLRTVSKNKKNGLETSKKRGKIKRKQRCVTKSGTKKEKKKCPLGGKGGENF